MTGDEIAEAVALHLRAVAAEHAAVIEVACEQALQGGACGVLAVWETAEDGEVRVTAEPSSEVPYGQLWSVAIDSRRMHTKEKP